MIKIPDFLNMLLDKAKSLGMEELNPGVTSGHSQSHGASNEPADITEIQRNTQITPVKKITFLKVITAIFNGMGIGLLLGVLLGLAVSPVVSGVVATLSGLLAVLLGLDEKYLDPLKSIRIGSFGFSAVAGIFLGLYIRAHDPFSPTMLDTKKEFIELGLEESEAKAYVMKKAQADTNFHKKNANVLYSSSITIDECEKLSDAKEDWPNSEIVSVFNYAGGTWEEFAKAFKTDLPDELLGKALLTMRDCFCGEGSTGVVKMINLVEIRKLGKDDPVEQIEKVLSSSASGENWQSIVKNVRNNIPDNQKKNVYLLTIKVLSHDQKN